MYHASQARLLEINTEDTHPFQDCRKDKDGENTARDTTKSFPCVLTPTSVTNKNELAADVTMNNQLENTNWTFELSADFGSYPKQNKKALFILICKNGDPTPRLSM